MELRRQGRLRWSRALERNFGFLMSRAAVAVGKTLPPKTHFVLVAFNPDSKAMHTYVPSHVTAAQAREILAEGTRALREPEQVIADDET